MNWATFDWGSWWLGFLVAIWLAIGIRELGEYIRRNNK